VVVRGVGVSKAQAENQKSVRRVSVKAAILLRGGLERIGITILDELKTNANR